MAYFYTSDPHYGHTNVIRYASRPFLTEGGQPDVQAMDREMVRRFNERVGPRDITYMLGDFTMNKHVSKIKQYRDKLNGKIILIRGNHDQSTDKMLQAGFDEVHNSLIIQVDGLTIYLAHIPIFSDDLDPRKYRDSLTPKPPPFYHYWFCGHVHNRWKRKGKIINVGVDAHSLYPKTFEEIIQTPLD